MLARKNFLLSSSTRKKAKRMSKKNFQGGETGGKKLKNKNWLAFGAEKVALCRWKAKKNVCMMWNN